MDPALPEAAASGVLRPGEAVLVDAVRAVEIAELREGGRGQDVRTLVFGRGLLEGEQRQVTRPFHISPLEEVPALGAACVEALACVHQVGALERTDGPRADPRGPPHRRLVEERRNDTEPEARVALVVTVERPGDRHAQIVEVVEQAVTPCDLVGTQQRRARILGEGRVVLGVASPPVVGRARLVELFPGVLAQRLEQVVAGRAVVRPLRDDHRFRDEVRQRVEHVEALDAVAADDCRRRVAVERAGEHTEAVEDEALAFGEQLVGPVDRRPQRLMALDGAPPPAGEEPEALVEQRRDLRRAHRHGTRRRELDRKGHAVETPADLGHGREVGGRHGEVGLGRSGPFDEQLHRVGRFDGVRVGVRPGQPQGSEGDDLLAVDRESLAARREQADVRAGLDDLLGQVASGIEQVLAVVEHEEQVLRPEVLDDALGQIHPRAARHCERRRDDLDQGLGAVGGRELDRATRRPGSAAAPARRPAPRGGSCRRRRHR